MSIDITPIILGVMTGGTGVFLGWMFTGRGTNNPSIKVFVASRKFKVPVRLTFSDNKWRPSLAPEAKNNDTRPLIGGTPLELAYENLITPNSDFANFAINMAKQKGVVFGPQKKKFMSFKKQPEITMPTLDEVIRKAQELKPATNDPRLLAQIDSILAMANGEKIVQKDGKYVWQTTVNLDEFEKHFPSGAVPSSLSSYRRRAAAEKAAKSEFDVSKGMKWVAMGVVFVLICAGIALLAGGKL